MITIAFYQKIISGALSLSGSTEIQHFLGEHAPPTRGCALCHLS